MSSLVSTIQNIFVFLLFIIVRPATLEYYSKIKRSNAIQNYAMSESFNIDQVVECVKNILDSNRCPICDKSGGSRLRYSCNHVVCCDCVAVSEECSLCLTPPKVSSPNKPVPDETLTQRAINAAKLLNTCEEAFNVDVHRRRKISEQLKVEKELFPECIQAPLKYSNKRKSSYVLRNKENNWRSIFPGEITSLFDESKMEKSMSYVQKWLDHNEKVSTVQTRRPFSDININNQQFNSKQKPIKQRGDIIHDKVKQNNENKPSKGTIRKRSYKARCAMDNDQTHLNKYLKPNDKSVTFGYGNTTTLKKNIDITDTSSEPKNKPDNDESGIVIEEEPFVIDDSQSQILDRDKAALLAVLQANENEETNSNTQVRLECSEVLNYTNDLEKSLSKSLHCNNSSVKRSPSLSFDFDNGDNKKLKTKVPFYKKAYFFDDCNHNYNEYSDRDTDDFNKVSITVNNDNFIAVIKVSKCKENKSIVSIKKSIAVQTDEPIELNESYTGNNIQDTIKQHSGKCAIEINKNNNSQSQDLFADEAKNTDDNLFSLDPVNNSKENVKQMLDVSRFKENKHLIIQDSDSDNDEESMVLEIQADVHRSSEQFNYGVLNQIKETELEHRKPAASRGRTPASTDSSDKENRDPNRPKKKITKKSYKKKDFVDLDAIQSLND